MCHFELLKCVTLLFAANCFHFVFIRIIMVKLTDFIFQFLSLKVTCTRQQNLILFCNDFSQQKLHVCLILSYNYKCNLTKHITDTMIHRSSSHRYLIEQLPSGCVSISAVLASGHWLKFVFFKLFCCWFTCSFIILYYWTSERQLQTAAMIFSLNTSWGFGDGVQTPLQRLPVRTFFFWRALDSFSMCLYLWVEQRFTYFFQPEQNILWAITHSIQ